MQTQRDPNQNSPRRRYSPGALGLPLLAGLAGLAGLLMLTGCIRCAYTAEPRSPGSISRHSDDNASWHNDKYHRKGGRSSTSAGSSGSSASSASSAFSPRSCRSEPTSVTSHLRGTGSFNDAASGHRYCDAGRRWPLVRRWQSGLG